MIIVSLNLRGLGRPKKRMAVQKLVQKYKVDCLIMQETKVWYEVFNIVREVWGNCRCMELGSFCGGSGSVDFYL